MRSNMTNMKPIIETQADADLLNWLVSTGVTHKAIEHAAEKISERGQRPYPSNIAKFYGRKIADFRRHSDPGKNPK